MATRQLAVAHFAKLWDAFVSPLLRAAEAKEPSGEAQGAITSTTAFVASDDAAEDDAGGK